MAQVLLDLTLRCNTTEEKIRENICASSARPLPWLTDAAAHDRVAVLVGGGPSLSDQLPALQRLMDQGAVLFALGNSARWLVARGLPVDFQVILDARPENADFVCPQAKSFLIASQCDPAVFDQAPAPNTTLWHACIENIGVSIGDVRPAPRPPHALIVGHSTIGLTALNLAYTMGYRALHLFGYDSSNRGSAEHAFPQALGAGHEPITVTYRGETYSGQPALIGQAQRFPRVAKQLTELGCEFFIYGDGLLPAIARHLTEDPPDRWVVECDLGKIPSRWDFFNWLMIAEMERRKHGVGALAVHFTAGPNDGFRNDGLPETIAQRREMLDGVLRPLLGMIGAGETEEPADLTVTDYRVAGVVERFKAGQDLPVLDEGDLARERISRFLHANERPIVITLREAPHWPARNSNLEAWTKFARNCGHSVVFVRDTAMANELLSGFRTCPDASLNVAVRLALYRRALVNLFVSNGPAELALLSTDIPYLMLKPLTKDWGNCGTKEFFEAFVGIELGGQFPWASPRQRIVWADDTLENITEAFEQFCAQILAPMFGVA